jgi:hypothetical protein
VLATAVAGLATGCAKASAPNQAQVDAPVVVIDAPTTKTDAPRPIDAPPPPIDAPAPTPDAPSADCETTITCTAPQELAGIGGDETGASTSGATGYQATWLQIRVSETDNGPLADPMSMQVTLTSPASQTFSLAIYMPSDATSTNCSTPSGSVSVSGATQTWVDEWGETGTFANGVDDSRTVAIQITPQSPDGCAAADTWSLSIVTGFD